MKFDSNEELYFSWWLEDLKKYGYINEYEYHPEPFILGNPIIREYKKQLKTKSKMVKETIMSGKIYTCDVFILWNDKAKDLFFVDIDSDSKKKKGNTIGEKLIAHKLDIQGDYFSYVEIKPSFDQNNMTMLAKVNIKWVWDKYKRYINITIPREHFKKTFTPLRYFMTDGGKQKRKISYKSKTFKEYLDGLA